MPALDTDPTMACDACGINVYGNPDAWIRIGVPEGKTHADTPKDMGEALRQGFTLIVLCPDCKALEG